MEKKPHIRKQEHSKVENSGHGVPNCTLPQLGALALAPLAPAQDLLEDVSFDNYPGLLDFRVEDRSTLWATASLLPSGSLHSFLKIILLIQKAE